MDSKIASKCSKLIVAAIDFGTTYSGYAFSLKDDWGKVLTNVWQGGSLLSHKAPTCLLLNKDHSVALFGYEAEDKYSDLTAEDKHKDYYFFQRFKMILHEDVSVKRHISCQDISGKTMEASIVFMHCIKCLKDHLLGLIKKSVLNLKDDDIQYVLTVPAIWGDKAKMFMREAAIKAGIKQEHLIIALEPEAASIFCQYLQIAKDDKSSAALGVVEPGSKYMVVDLGGGTADITVHQKCEDNTLQEILPASGGPWGGKSVDDLFVKFITELVGEKVMEEFKKKHMEDYLEIMRTFETKKRTIKPDKGGNTNMTIPQALLKLCTKTNGVQNFKDVIDRNQMHRNNVTYATGKLKWETKYFRGFFKKAIDSIVKHIDELFDEEVVRGVDIIVMVGGFSECMLVQDAIKKHFEQKNVIVPDEAGLAVVKGAVYFGHVPDAISRRSARYTYGIQTWPEFKEDRHPKEKKVMINGSMRCKDVFFKVITKGDKIMPGFVKSQVFHALNSGEKCLECGVFISDSKNPSYVDESDCRMLGILQVPLSGESGETTIEESLIFGETELRFQARDLYSNVHREILFDLLKD